MHNSRACCHLQVCLYVLCGSQGVTLCLLVQYTLSIVACLHTYVHTVIQYFHARAHCFCWSIPPPPSLCLCVQHLGDGRERIRCRRIRFPVLRRLTGRHFHHSFLATEHQPLHLWKSQTIKFFFNSQAAEETEIMVTGNEGVGGATWRIFLNIFWRLLQYLCPCVCVCVYIMRECNSRLLRGTTLY